MDLSLTAILITAAAIIGGLLGIMSGSIGVVIAAALALILFIAVRYIPVPMCETWTIGSDGQQVILIPTMEPDLDRWETLVVALLCVLVILLCIGVLIAGIVCTILTLV
jgi:hypothetical protein